MSGLWTETDEVPEHVNILQTDIDKNNYHYTFITTFHRMASKFYNIEWPLQEGETIIITPGIGAFSIIIHIIHYIIILLCLRNLVDYNTKLNVILYKISSYTYGTIYMNDVILVILKLHNIIS